MQDNARIVPLKAPCGHYYITRTRVRVNKALAAHEGSEAKLS